MTSLKKIMNVIDKVAVMKEKRVKQNSQEWFDGEIVDEIKNRDRSHWPAFKDFFSKVKGFPTDMCIFWWAESKNTIHFLWSGQIFEIWLVHVLILTRYWPFDMVTKKIIKNFFFTQV